MCALLAAIGGKDCREIYLGDSYSEIRPRPKKTDCSFSKLLFRVCMNNESLLCLSSHIFSIYWCKFYQIIWIYESFWHARYEEAPAHLIVTNAQKRRNKDAHLIATHRKKKGTKGFEIAEFILQLRKSSPTVENGAGEVVKFQGCHHWRKEEFVNRDKHTLPDGSQCVAYYINRRILLFGGKIVQTFVV